MKKLLLLAGLAVAATVSCTKNETFENGQDGSLISFLPLTSMQTKSSPVDGTALPENETGNFRVYGWYQDKKESTSFDPEKAHTLYMNNVLCQYTAGATETHQKSWLPENTYFWPKDGKLTFSAYYPATMQNVIVDEKTGISLTDYTIDDAANQVDFMYSNRAFDKTASTGTSTVYDGVDIVFNHALAAADFAIKTDADYGTAITVDNITLINAFSKGSFKEGYTNGTAAETPKATWSSQSAAKEYTVFSDAKQVTTDLTAVGNTMILLPQDFSDDVKISVSYRIKYKNGNDFSDFPQTAEFQLKGANAEIKGWEMGKWYHYTLTFTLDKIHFAPSVSDWDDVTVGGMTIE